MQKLSIILISILIITPILSAGGKNEEIDDIDNQVAASSSYMKLFLSDFLDLSIPNREIVEKLTALFSEILLVPFEFSEEVPLHEQLFSLFNAETYINNFPVSLRTFSSEIMKLSIGNLKKRETLDFSFVLAKSSNDKQAAKTEYLNNLISCFQEIIKLIHKHMVKQMFIEMESDKILKANNQKGKTDFNINPHQSLVSELYQEFTAKVKELNEKETILEDEEILNYVSVLKLILINEYNTIKVVISFFAHTMKQLEQLFDEMFRFSTAKVAFLLREDIDESFNEVLIKHAVERTEIAVKILKLMRPALPDYDYINGLLTFSKINTDIYRLKNPSLFYNDAFKRFVIDIQHNLFQESLNLLPNELIIAHLKKMFEANHKADVNDVNIQKLIQFIYSLSPFDASVSWVMEEDTYKKLYIADLILYLKSEVFSLEMIQDIVNNYKGLRNLSRIRKSFFSKTKIFFYKYASDPVFSPELVKFYTKFYSATIDFAIFVDEKAATTYNMHELFDQFIDKYGDQTRDDWMISNSIIIKIYNLFFIKETSNYDTQFPEIKEDSIIGKSLVQELSKNVKFYDDCNLACQTINGIKENLTPLQMVAILSDFKGKANKFNRYIFLYKEIVEEQQIDIKKQPVSFQINFLNSSLNPLNISRNRRNSLMKSRQGSGNFGSFIGNSWNKASSGSPSVGSIQSLIEEVNEEGLDSETENEPTEEDVFSHLPLRKAKSTSNISPVYSLNTESENISISFQRHESISNQPSENIINEIFGKISKDHIMALKNLEVKDFIDNENIVATNGDTEITNVFVVVSRKESPCHPQELENE